MNLNRLNMLLWSELFGDLAAVCVHRNQQHECFCVHVCNRSRWKWGTHMCRAVPSSTDCSCRTMTAFLNLSITVLLFSYPQRSLVSSDLPPVCIRKERLHCPAHGWYLISLQALGANPTTSCLSCWCLWMWGCLYRHAHLLPLAAFPDLLWTRREQDCGSNWLQSSAANISSLSFLQKLYIAFLL